MCHTIEIGNHLCETVGQLTELNIEVHKEDSYQESLENDDCLCGVDIDKTLENAGLLYIKHEWGDYTVFAQLTITGRPGQ